MKTRIAIIIALALTSAACTSDPTAEAAPTTPTTTTETAKFNPPEDPTTTTAEPTTTNAPADLAPGELPPLIPDPVIDGGRTDAEAEADGVEGFNPSKEDLEQFKVLAKMYEQWRQIRFQAASPPDPGYPGLDRYTPDGGVGWQQYLEEKLDAGETWVLGGDAESTPEYWDENIRMFLRVAGRERVTFVFCTTVWAYIIDAAGEPVHGSHGPWKPSTRSVTFRRTDDKWGIWEETTTTEDPECVDQDYYEL